MPGVNNPTITASVKRSLDGNLHAAFPNGNAVILGYAAGGLTVSSGVMTGALITPNNVGSISGAVAAALGTASGTYTAPSQGGGTYGNIIEAASPSLADVQAAVTAASDGDVVVIPDGSATWNGGITTSKQIIVMAKNYTPTPLGSPTRNANITLNTANHAFNFTSGNSYHCGVGGIHFKYLGGGTIPRSLWFQGSGSKIPLVFDCTFDSPYLGGNNPGDAYIELQSMGALFWNCWWDSLIDPTDGAAMQEPGGGLGIHTTHPLAWTTASTMGQLDANGNVNYYIESSTAINTVMWFDVDVRGRAVVRDCELDGTSFLTHGFTSGMYNGGRHVEIYDNVLSNSNTLSVPRNIAGRYFWLRAGTAVVADNVVNGDADESAYGGTNVAIDVGDQDDTETPNNPMSPGWGHDGVTDVLDPIYIWGNTVLGDDYGMRANWAPYVTVASVPDEPGAELFAGLGAKPGYSKYTYPHPARDSIPVLRFAASASYADVSSAVAAASDGDTVVVPSTSGTPVVWNSTLTVDKAITIAGAGTDATTGTVIDANAENGPAFSLIAPASGLQKLQGFRFVGGNANRWNGHAFNTSGTYPTQRITDCYMGQMTHWAYAAYGTYFLMDNCTLFDTFGGLHQGAGWSAWESELDFGSANWHFIENCDYPNSDSYYGSTSGPMFDVQHGGKVVFRHNTGNHCFGETHETIRLGSLASGRGFELYENAFTSGDNVWKGFDLNCGSGVVYNNAFSGSYSFPIGFYDYKTDDNRGWPACDGTDTLRDGNNPGESGRLCWMQIGTKYVGFPSTPDANSDWASYVQSDPVYMWGNTYNGGTTDVIGVSGANSGIKIQDGRDYFSNTQKPGYVAYQYPHPLRSA